MVWPSRPDREFYSKVWASSFHNVPSVRPSRTLWRSLINAHSIFQSSILLDWSVARTHNGRHSCDWGKDQRGARQAETVGRSAWHERRRRLNQTRWWRIIEKIPPVDFKIPIFYTYILCFFFWFQLVFLTSSHAIKHWKKWHYDWSSFIFAFFGVFSLMKAFNGFAVDLEIKNMF